MSDDPNYTYSWYVTGAIQYKPKLYQGSSANYNNNWLGSSARSLAKIPLSNSTNFKFATFLFCDYANNFIISNSLKIYITGVYYDPNSYVQVTSVQRSFFN